MKKIFFLLAMAGLIQAQAQQTQQRSLSPTVKMSAEEANRLNGNTEPTINGKPYSQYKAEQEALKNAPATKAPNNPAMITVNGGALPAKATMQISGIPSAVKGNNDGGTATERKVENKVAPVEEKTTTPVQPDYFANPTSVRLVAPEVPIEDKPVIENKPARVPVETKDVQPAPDKSVKSEKKAESKGNDQQAKTKPGQTN